MADFGLEFSSSSFDEFAKAVDRFTKVADKVDIQIDGIATALKKVNEKKLTTLAKGLNELAESASKFTKARADNISSMTIALTQLSKINDKKLNSIVKSTASLAPALNRLTSNRAKAIGQIGDELLKLANIKPPKELFNGISEGLAGITPEFRRIAKVAANEFIDTLKREWQIKSPSERVYALGVSLTQGLKKGVAGMKLIAQDTATAFIDRFVGTFQNAGYEGLGDVIYQTITSLISRPLADAISASLVDIRQKAEQFAQVIKGVTAVFGGVLISFKDFATTLPKHILSLRERVPAALSIVQSAVTEIFDDFVGIPARGLDNFIKVMGGRLDKVARFLAQSIPTTVKVFGKFFTDIGKEFALDLKAIYDASPVVKFIADSIGDILNTVKPLRVALVAVARSARELIGNVVSAFGESFKAGYQHVKNGISTFYSNIRSDLGTFVGNMSLSFRIVASSLKDTWQTMFTGVEEAIKLVPISLSLAYEDVVRRVQSGAKKVGNALKRTFSFLGDGARGARNILSKLTLGIIKPVDSSDGIDRAAKEALETSEAAEVLTDNTDKATASITEATKATNNMANQVEVLDNILDRLSKVGMKPADLDTVKGVFSELISVPAGIVKALGKLPKRSLSDSDALTDMIQKMSNIIKSIGGISKGNITVASSTATLIADTMGTILNTLKPIIGGNFFQRLFGKGLRIKQGQLSTFSESFVAMRTMIAEIGTLSDIQVGVVDLSGIKNTLSQVLDLFGGSNNIFRRMIDAVPFFKRGIISQIARIDVGELKRLTTALKEIIGISSSIAELKGVSAVELSTEEMNALTSSVEKIVRFFSGFSRLESLKNLVKGGGLGRFKSFKNIFMGDRGIFGELSKLDGSKLKPAIDSMRSIMDFTAALGTLEKVRIGDIDFSSFRNAMNALTKVFAGDKKFFIFKRGGIFDILAKVSQGTLEKAKLGISAITSFLRATRDIGDVALEVSTAKRIRESFVELARSFTDIEKVTQGVDAGRIDKISAALGRFARSSQALDDNGFEMSNDLAREIARGLKEGLKDLPKIMREAIEEVIQVARDELGIASPSRIFIGIGKQVVKGFEVGTAGLAAVLRGIGNSILTFVNRVGAATGSAFGKIGRTLRNLAPDRIFAGMGRAARHFNEISEFIDRIFNRVQQIGQATVGIAIEFESAFVGVAKALDTSTLSSTEEAEFLNTLEAQIMDLATSADSMVAGLENGFVTLSEISANAAQLGIGGQELLEGNAEAAQEQILSFTEVIAQLTQATDLTSQDAAFTLARLATLTRTDDYEALGSAVVALGNSFAATESDIVGVADRLKSLPLDPADILAWSTAIAASGISAESGGSSTTRVMQTLSRTLLDGEQAFDKYSAALDKANLSNEEFAELVETDISTAFFRLLEGASQLTELEQLAFLESAGIRSSEDIRLFQTLARNIGTVEGALNTANDQFVGFGDTVEEYNALQEETARRQATMEFQTRRLANVWRETRATFGELFFEPLSVGIGGLASGFEGFTDMMRRNSASITQFIGNTVTPLLELTGALASTAMTVVRFINTFMPFGTVAQRFGDSIRFITNQITDFQMRVGRFLQIGVAQDVAVPLTPQQELEVEREYNLLLQERTEIEQALADARENGNDTAAESISHTIEAGDTLSELAAKYDTTVEALVALNDIEDPNLIFIGDELIISNEQIDQVNELEAALLDVNAAIEDFGLTTPEIEVAENEELSRQAEIIRGEFGDIVDSAILAKDSIRDFFSGDIDFTTLTTNLSSALSEASESFGSIIDVIMFGATGGDSGQTLKDRILEDDFGTIIGSDLEIGGLAGVIQNMFALSSVEINRIAGFVSDNLSSILFAAFSLLTGSVTGITAVFSFLPLFAEALESDLGGLGTSLQESEFGTALYEFVIAIGGAIGDTFTAIGDLMATGDTEAFGDAMSENITSFTDGLISGITSLISGAIQAIPGLVQAGAPIVAEIGEAIVNGLIDGLVGFLETSVVEPAKQGELGEAMLNLIAGAFGLYAVGGAGAAFVAGSGALASIATGLSGAISAAIALINPVTILAGLTALLVGLVVDENFRNSVVDAFRGLGQDLVDGMFGEGAWNAALDSIELFFTDLIIGFAQGIDRIILATEIWFNQTSANVNRARANFSPDRAAADALFEAADAAGARADALITIQSIIDGQQVTIQEISDVLAGDADVAERLLSNARGLFDRLDLADFLIGAEGAGISREDIGTLLANSGLTPEAINLAMVEAFSAGALDTLDIERILSEANVEGVSVDTVMAGFNMQELGRRVGDAWNNLLDMAGLGELDDQDFATMYSDIISATDEDADQVKQDFAAFIGRIDWSTITDEQRIDLAEMINFAEDAEIISEGDLRSIGFGINHGIAQGIIEDDTAITNIRALAEDLKSNFQLDLGIESPSKVFKEYGTYIIDGLALGLTPHPFIKFKEDGTILLEEMYEDTDKILEDFEDRFTDTHKHVRKTTRKMSEDVRRMQDIMTESFEDIAEALIVLPTLFRNLEYAATNSIIRIADQFLELADAVKAVLVRLGQLLAKIKELEGIGIGVTITVSKPDNRYLGGDVLAGQLYEINENRLPYELFTTGEQMFMLPNVNGSVISPKTTDMSTIFGTSEPEFAFEQPQNMGTYTMNSYESTSNYSSSSHVDNSVTVIVDGVPAGVSSSDVQYIKSEVEAGIMRGLDKNAKRNTLNRGRNRRGLR